MDTMSPLDSTFLHIEDDVSHMHIASTAIFEGPPPPYTEILEMVEGKLPLVPRYRQVVRFVPLQLGRPVWVDDPHFNIEYHVRHSALPSPGSEEQLRHTVGRLMSQPLDRTKPLWELWMLEGLEDGNWAIVSKTHHCMVDGVSGTDLLAVVMDTTPEPSPPIADDWTPALAPSSAELAVRAVVSTAVSPYEQIRAVRSRLRAPRQLADQLQEAARGLVSMSSLVRPNEKSSLNGPIGPHRRYDWATTTLDDIKKVRKSHGGTVNDVVLAAITQGFRDLLISRGESVENRVVRTLVPVSVRAPGGEGVYNNQVSAMFASLPVGIDDPVECLEAVTTQMNGLKESKQAVAGERLTALSGFAPPMLLALGMRAFSRVNQRNVNTVTTNVPGPQMPLYARGRKMLRAFPYVPLAGSVRIGIAIFSYQGEFNFGVTGDYDSVPDIDVLCCGIENGMQALLDASS